MNYLLSLDVLQLADSAAETEAATANPWTSNLMLFGLLAGVMVVMYFFTIRPQRKREKDLKKQVDMMAVGDSIVTIGGVAGTVANIQDSDITITTSRAHTLITFKKSAISTVVKRDSAE